MDADRANRMLKTTIKDRTLEDLASGKITVLKFTGVETVVNFDLPEQDAYERYIDRIGCCWRVGNTGHAISYFDPDSPKDVQNAEEYVETLKPTGHEVPDFLLESVQVQMNECSLCG
uniref:KTSC domain-containing protein n=1 Tax=Globodera pallida TaxID=36090 RepID=A0A183C5A8_GLOPA